MPLALMGAPVRARWPYVMLALLALAGLVFGFFGMMMAGSYSVATTWPPPPGYTAYWHRVADAYLVLSLVSLATLIVALIGLWRRRRSRAFRVESQQAAS